jgi:hypothetical protein
MTPTVTKMKKNIQQLDEAVISHCWFTAIKDHLYSDLKDEGVILSLRNGKYYGLNEVGRSVWQIIQTPVTIVDIQKAIMDEYEIDEVNCKAEILTFLKLMAEEELVEIKDEKDS